MKNVKKMKTIRRIIPIAFLLFLCLPNISFAQVSINNDGADPDASAMLDIQSTTKGVLIPRMSTTEREMISNGAVGLLVFDTTTKSFWFKNSTTTWKELVANAGSLDDAYDNGGSGAGREIIADEGAVEINGEDGLTVTGTRGSGDQIAVTGAGTRMFFNPNKAAFRAGQVEGSNWDHANLGNQSTAFGLSTVALGNHSFAVGDSALALKNQTIAMGKNVVAEEIGSRAIGENAIATGFHSTAMGFNVQTFSSFETVIGFNAEPYTPNAPFPPLWDNDDRLFVVGNGLSVESNFVLSNEPHNAFTILKRGNVGIGVSDPFTMLEVEGDVSFGVGNNKLSPPGYDRRTLMIAGKLRYSDNTDPKVRITRLNMTSSSYLVGDAVRNQEGDYTISFTTNPSPRFSEPPIVVCTAAPNTSGATRIIAVTEVSTTSFRVTVRSSNGERVDDSFNFMLIGENDDYFNN